ncbi:MAG: SDR family oxidoreductase [Candidatus Omnitrophica bacterium]|nr:SDR family oxidoreductase [Candidatus Omnitrophota bacterium]
MKYDLLVIGAGYVGGALARNFRLRNKNVAVLIHSPANKIIFENQGIATVLGDITESETLKKIPPAKNILIAVSPAVRDASSYRKVYVEGAGNILETLRDVSRQDRVLYISSTGVYGDQKGGWVDEATSPAPDNPLGKILLEAEHQVLASGLPSIILRLSGIYGPGRNRWLNSRQNISERYINMIHLEDIVRIMALLFEEGKLGDIYLGSDDEPVLRSDFYRWLGAKTDSLSQDHHLSGKRCRNHKLKSLGFSFKYPTFREGYQSLKEGL